MKSIRVRFVLACLLVISAASLVQDVAYASREFRRASTGPRMLRTLYGTYTETIERALALIPPDAAVGVFWNQQPFLFNYYLYPRKIFSTPDLLPSEAPYVGEIASRRGLRWILGKEIYAPPRRADPGPFIRKSRPGP